MALTTLVYVLFVCATLKVRRRIGGISCMGLDRFITFHIKGRQYERNWNKENGMDVVEQEETFHI